MDWNRLDSYAFGQTASPVVLAMDGAGRVSLDICFDRRDAQHANRDRGGFADICEIPNQRGEYSDPVPDPSNIELWYHTIRLTKIFKK